MKYRFTVAMKSGRVVSGKIKSNEEDVSRVRSIFRKVAMKETVGGFITLDNEIFDANEIESLKIKKVLF